MKTKHFLIAGAIVVLAAVNAVTITWVWQESKPRHVAELYPSDQLIRHIQR